MSSQENNGGAADPASMPPPTSLPAPAPLIAGGNQNNDPLAALMAPPSYRLPSSCIIRYITSIEVFINVSYIIILIHSASLPIVSNVANNDDPLASLMAPPPSRYNYSR